MSKILKSIANTLAQTATNYTGAVILAAGNSTRMGGKINKQLYELNGKPVLAHTLLAYQKCPLIKEIVVVTRPRDFQAASVLAKTYRDEYMRRLAVEYPHYGWERNMGYPTKEHIDAIIAHGYTPHHRKSFHLKQLEPTLF